MKLSYNWLKQLLPGLKKSPQQLGEILSMQIAEVEEIFKLSQGLEKVIVAEIIKIKPHPRADKLKIAVVNNGKAKQEIVCGASNIKDGQKVPLALSGAVLPNGMEIKPAVIRGVKSNGMLCSEDELGLGSDQEGILILPSSLKPGQLLTKALKLDDTILDVENKSLTHRPDLFSHIGFAREIGVVLNIKPKFKDLKLKSTSNKSPIQIKVEDKKLCPRYMAVVMDDVKIAPSPDWLQTRLRNLGIKSINNVVDITNYILTEIGQPLHAFDANKLAPTNYESKQITNKQIQIIIRRAKANEKLLALDGQEYKLLNDN
ncbi:phenylalanine--tRNA ligase subunit beta, partial [Patescibacteria group bacterium]|nr:phenylalanine--tRNA ligase subunit beta [Patescibacteria group bacterium]